MFQKQAPAGEKTFFKPKDAPEGAVYALFPKHFEAEKPTPYGPKDTAVAEAFVFANGKGEPEHHPLWQTEATVLARSIGRALDAGGAPLLVTIGKGVAKPGKQAPWVFNDADPSEYPDVVAFFEKREKELDDAPDF